MISQVQQPSLGAFTLAHIPPVLGIPHPAVATRDVALYVPFRNALSSPNQIIGLQTLMWHLMSRRIQDQQQNPVSASRTASYGDNRHAYFKTLTPILARYLSLKTLVPHWIFTARSPLNGSLQCLTVTGRRPFHPARSPGATFRSCCFLSFCSTTLFILSVTLTIRSLNCHLNTTIPSIHHTCIICLFSFHLCNILIAPTIIVVSPWISCYFRVRIVPCTMPLNAGTHCC
jgi:hypothetical protein